MTNQQRQASLDKQKWLDSEIAGCDLSGEMWYCKHCPHQVDTPCGDYCSITHEQRVANCLCAKAYNRMVRIKR